MIPNPKRSFLRGRPLSYVACNYCGSDVTRNLHDVSRLVECFECSLIFVNPRPDFSDLAAQYEETYFQCSQPTFGGYEDYEGDREDILRTFARRIDAIGTHARIDRPRTLDLGCATGLFLEAAATAGWQAEGIDISAYAVARARQKGLRVQQGQLEELRFPEASFDMITMWDVIEHVPDPSGLLAECERILAPKGVLVISTPDAGSLLAKVLRGKWLGFRSIDEHLYFFTRQTLAAMLQRVGFEVPYISSVGKYISVARIIARLRYYTRIAAWLLRSVDRFAPRLSVYLNPGDTMLVLAIKREDSLAATTGPHGELPERLRSHFNTTTPRV